MISGGIDSLMAGFRGIQTAARGLRGVAVAEDEGAGAEVILFEDWGGGGEGLKRSGKRVKREIKRTQLLTRKSMSCCILVHTVHTRSDLNKL